MAATEHAIAKGLLAYNLIAAHFVKSISQYGFAEDRARNTLEDALETAIQQDPGRASQLRQAATEFSGAIDWGVELMTKPHPSGPRKK
ncbi:hypothetical protein FHS31_000807 [Sphingomonas vulcanisoli]|uniref:Uncharacterized protein n=1 Tax=Sphingomonas vulcanisoli TaxID=1658060 RepID=A0ABX0TUF5_9SPHN|nr:hypothetical protein [Sphingomonas vulcanisoli]NIJ07211.1 hypothetical protein [Sphingomonas vulcanisoli]